MKKFKKNNGKSLNNIALMAEICFASSILSGNLLASNLIENNKKTQNSKELSTITVTASKKNDSFIVNDSKIFQLPKPLLETPQSINVISRQLLDDQNATNMKDSLKNVAGISVTAGEGSSQGDNLTIRGFSARNDFFIDGIRDFGSYYRDPFNLENIEVIQGPSSIAFGRGSAGGVIEQNSKEAFLGDKKKISLISGSNNTYRSTIDINKKISKISGSAFRLNVMANQNSFARRNEVENRRYGIAPTIGFGLDSELRLTISHLFQKEDNIPDYGTPWFGASPANIRQSNYYGFKNDYLKTSVNLTTVKVEYDVNDIVNAKNQTRYGRYSRDIRATYPSIANSIALTTPLSNINVSRNMIAVNSIEEISANQFDVSSKFKIANFDNQLISGALISRESSTPTRYDYSGVTATSLVNPNNNDIFTGNKTTRFSLKANIDTASLYAIDIIELTKKLNLTSAIRFDNLKSTQTQSIPTSQKLSRSDNAVNYNFALLYKLNDNSSYYFNHGTSFNPAADQIALTDSSSVSLANSAVEKNKIYEVGGKWSWLKKSLNTAFSIFRIEKDNARERNSSNVYVVVGKQRVDGVQAQITGNITNNLKINSSYSLLNSAVIESFDSKRIGHRLVNVPLHSFNIFTNYQINKNFEIGGGLNALSKRFASTANDVNAGIPRRASGYVVSNLMLKYKPSYQSLQAFEVQLNIDNLFNNKFSDQIYSSYVVPAQGRVAMININAKF